MNAYQTDRSKDRTSRPGFTLIELLITIAIIGILAAIALGAVQAARQAARAAKTRATISKLNDIVLDQYDSYHDRRVQSIPRAPQLARRQTLERRLNMTRDLMRLEMPQRWEDVIGHNVNSEKGPLAFPCQLCKKKGCSACDKGYYQLPEPALWRIYLERYSEAYDRGIDTTTLNTYASAECLYLIVSATNPRALKTFPDNDIGDVDGDGLKEFVDGWGNPIMFLRWAPGVADSEVQSVVTEIKIEKDSNGKETEAARFQLARALDAVENDYDPFDPFQVDKSLDNTNNSPPRSWRLVPFIFSAGPDGIYDILYDIGDTSNAGTPTELEKITPFKNVGNPFYFHPSFGRIFNMLGAPTSEFVNKSLTAPNAENESLDHYDNIHNHRLQVR